MLAAKSAASLVLKKGFWKVVLKAPWKDEQLDLKLVERLGATWVCLRVFQMVA